MSLPYLERVAGHFQEYLTQAPDTSGLLTCALLITASAILLAPTIFVYAVGVLSVDVLKRHIWGEKTEVVNAATRPYKIGLWIVSMIILCSSLFVMDDHSVPFYFRFLALCTLAPPFVACLTVWVVSGKKDSAKVETIAQ